MPHEHAAVSYPLQDFEPLIKHRLCANGPDRYHDYARFLHTIFSTSVRTANRVLAGGRS